jgi:hypothetical protein
MEYSSYGKSADEAEAEAQTYFTELKRLIARQHRTTKSRRLNQRR